MKPGQLIGPYRVEGKLGEGGMGEVYRATDSNLARQVAIKVLPESVASDPERLARFDREAKTLAALNHPNIAQIYGLEKSGSTTALVMELVEGPTLADRIAQGPGTPEAESLRSNPRDTDGSVIASGSPEPSRRAERGATARPQRNRRGGAPHGLELDDALPIAKQIAEALEAAHEQGIIHRDLKPANIKVRDDGTVKVLDFGLAKALERPGGDGEPGRPGGLSMSPTITTPAMTQAGMILGTAAYMSPEQAKGRPADRRADVWAFGCVLYEMLTGRQAFPGEDVTEVLAAVVRAEPDWGALPKDTPPAIETLLRRCLRKDPLQRLADLSAARLEIGDAIAGRGVVSVSEPRAPRTGLSPGVALAAGTAIATVGAILGWALKPPPVPAPSAPARVQVTLAATDMLDRGARNIALSPDGQTLAYVAVRDGVSRIYVRPLDASEATALEGTEGAYNPFFSPDGRWLGFFAQGQMKKMPVDGGAAQSLTAIGGLSTGASWGPDGTIVYAPSIIGDAGLWRVSADGGTPSMLTTPDTARGEYSHRYPQILPGGRAVLFTSLRGFGWDESNVEALVLDTGERRVLVHGGHTGRYVAGGHLLYHRAGSLVDIPFDPDRLEVGDAKPATIADGVMENSGPSGALYAVSSAGTIAYVSAPGGSRQFERQLAWIDRQGRRELLEAPARNYREAALSPDGRQVVVTIGAGTDNLWLYDLTRESLTRLTSEQSSSETPEWTPDSREIAYRNNAAGRWQVYARPADASSTAEGAPLTVSETNDWPGGFSPDGRVLAFVRNTGTSRYGIWMLPLGGDEQPRAFVETPATEQDPQFSPDGRWLAYTSDESGGPQVYVTPYPGRGPRVQVSTDGGDSPQWNPRGGELFYRNGSRTMVVSVTTGATFTADRPRLLYEGPWGGVTPDGQRFLSIVSLAPGSELREINLMMNVLN